jgi:signal peptidase I
MNDVEPQETDGATRRSTAARIGIVLLNLLSLGLGLLRLSRPRAWFGYLLLGAIASSVTLATFMLVRNISYAAFFTLAGGVLLLLFGALIAAMVHSWRCSAWIDPAPRWYARWYSVLLVWLVLSAATWPLRDFGRSWYRTMYAPSESMVPSVRSGDYFLVDMHITGELKRGDVVIVRTGRGEDVSYIKRIAALPGDAIAMRDGVPVINGQPVTQVFVKSEMVDDHVTPPAPGRVLNEQLPGEAGTHRVMDMGFSELDDTPEVRLGKGEYFLLGDNRDNSADSRVPAETFGLGVVDRARITGRVLFIYWRRGKGLGEIKP